MQPKLNFRPAVKLDFHTTKLMDNCNFEDDMHISDFIAPFDSVKTDYDNPTYMDEQMPR